MSESKKIQMRDMFNTIAGNYDQLNKLITFGMDKKWRNNVLDIVKKHQPKNILDIATGTGDMVIRYANEIKAQRIVGVDISEGMLKVAEEKIESLPNGNLIELKVSEAEALPYEDAAFDVVSITYGIRNFEDLMQGLKETRRVLNKNGICVILETSVPTKFPFKQGYHLYTKRVMPIWGKILSKDKTAYNYLSSSALEFPYGEKMKAILVQAGFKSVQILPQANGISTIYVAHK